MVLTQDCLSLIWLIIAILTEQLMKLSTREAHYKSFFTSPWAKTKTLQVDDDALVQSAPNDTFTSQKYLQVSLIW